MPSFVYLGLNRRGVAEDGLVEADDRAAAQVQLEQMGLQVVSLSLVETPEPGRQKQELPPLLRVPELPAARLGADSLHLFTLQFLVMLRAGVGYVRLLETLSRSEDLDIAEVAGDLLGRVEGGQALSEAMERHPRSFDPLYLRMVRVGERTGGMEQSLALLLGVIERTGSTRRRVTAAVMNPLFILVASLAMTCFLVYGMLPGYLKVFAATGLALPAPTRWLLGLSSTYLPLVLLSLPLLGGLALAVTSEQAGSRQVISYLQYQLPPLARVTRALLVSRVVRQLAILLQANVGVDDALHLLCHPSCGYARMDHCLQSGREAVRRGSSLAQALQQEGVMPASVVEAVAAGEQVGRIPELLTRWADMLDEEVEYLVEQVVALVEPVLLVGLGLVIGAIVLAAFAPIFTLVASL